MEAAGYNAFIISTIVDIMTLCTTNKGYNAFIISTIVDQGLVGMGM